MKKAADNFWMYLPSIIGVVTFIVNLNNGTVSSSLPGLDNVVESIINFTSIIIGILTALFGVVVTLSDKDVMKKLQQNRGDKTIYKYSVETLLSNFVVLILSIVLQSLLEFKPILLWTDCFLNFWISILMFALFSSIRTIYYLLLISFNQDNKSERPKSSLTISDEKLKDFRMKNSFHNDGE